MNFNLNYFVGIFAGINTTISFLPQVIKIYINKSTGDISSTMYFVYTMGAVSWILYGTLVNDYIIIIFNSISVILICLVYLGFHLYKNKPSLIENNIIENNNNVI
jgi:MtN3 and saliva related transmembrane protein